MGEADRSGSKIPATGRWICGPGLSPRRIGFATCTSFPTKSFPHPSARDTDNRRASGSFWGVRESSISICGCQPTQSGGNGGSSVLEWDRLSRARGRPFGLGGRNERIGKFPSSINVKLTDSGPESSIREWRKYKHSTITWSHYGHVLKSTKTNKTCSWK